MATLTLSTAPQAGGSPLTLATAAPPPAPTTLQVPVAGQQPAPVAPSVPAPGVPPIGLIGSEQALTQGLQSALGSLTTPISVGGVGPAANIGGAQQGLGELTQQALAQLAGAGAGIDQAALTAQGTLGTAQQQVSSQIASALQQLAQAGIAGGALFDEARTGLQTTQADALAQLGLGQEFLSSALGTGLGAIEQAQLEGTAPLSPFIAPGQQSAQLQAALSGALGFEAQQQAIANFQSSPGQQFLQEQAELALLRNAAATGGLGGGQVLSELQRQAIGLAQQDFQNQFARLGDVTGTGLSAAGQLSNLIQSLAGLETGLVSQIGTQQAGLTQTGAGIISDIGQAIAGLATPQAQLGLQTAQAVGDLTATEAQLGSQLASQLAGLQFDVGTEQAQLDQVAAGLLQQQGITGAQLTAQLAGIQSAQAQSAAQQATQRQIAASGLNQTIAQLIAAGRLGAGQDIAQAISGTTSGLSALQQQQGVGLADILGTGAGNIAEILQAAGTGSATNVNNLISLLTGLATQGSGQIASIPIVTPQPVNTFSTLGQAAEGVGTALEVLGEDE